MNPSATDRSEDREGELQSCGVFLHTQWPPTCGPAAYQPIQGPAHLVRLAGGLEAGDVVIGGTGAEAGAGAVRVPALPDLWGVDMQQKPEVRGGLGFPQP